MHREDAGVAEKQMQVPPLRRACARDSGRDDGVSLLESGREDELRL